MSDEMLMSIGAIVVGIGLGGVIVVITVGTVASAIWLLRKVL